MTERRGKQQRGIATQTALIEASARVFARMEYDTAKLKDISEEAGISLGSLYFHFGNKDDIASAVLDEQQTRMKTVLSAVAEAPHEHALAQLLSLIDEMAVLISRDTMVQAGIRLLNSLPDELQARGYGDYVSWQEITQEIIVAGIADGSVTSPRSAEELAEILNEVFVGAQVMSGMRDAWASLPVRITRVRPLLLELFAPTGTR